LLWNQSHTLIACLIHKINRKNKKDISTKIILQDPTQNDILLKNMSKVYIASDHAGFKLKLELIKFIQNELKLQVEDVGCHTADRCDYPDFSVGLGKAVLNDTSS